MNRLYVIKVGSLEIRGLISPGELPEVVSSFYSVSKQRGATADFMGNGVFLAQRGEILLTLTIGEYHESIPSRQLVDALREVMVSVFKL